MFHWIDLRTKKYHFLNVSPKHVFFQNECMKFLLKYAKPLEENNDEDQTIATALSIGIKTDTADLTSDNTADLDWKASQDLIRLVNRKHLQAIVNYPIPPYHFELRSFLDKEENIYIM